MMYSITMALSRLRMNLLSHCFIALQLFLGFSVLCTSFNINFSLNNRLLELENSIQNSQIRVDILNSSLEDGSFKYATYAKMPSDPTCPTGILTTTIVKSTINGLPDSIVALCVPDRYYYDLFATNIVESHVYCSQELYDAITKNKVYLFGSGTSLSLSGNKCSIDGHEYNLTVIDNVYNLTEISRDENPDHNIDIDKLLIFPQTAGDFWEHDEFVSFQVYFYPTASDHYLDAYKILYENFHDISISIYDPAASLLKSCQDIIDMINLSTLISVILLFITLVGTIGIFLVSIYRRKKDIAVSIAIGSPLWSIHFELFIEVFIVCVAGILFGAIGAAGITMLINSRIVFFDANYTLQTIGIIILSSIFIPALVAKLSLLGFGEINVTALLHGEE